MPIRHILIEAGRSIGRARAAFALATGVQAVCLTLLGVFFLVAFNLVAVARTASRSLELHAFLADDADGAALEDRVGRITGVAAARHVTKEEALEELRAELGEDVSIIDALDSNPLPASIRVMVQSGYASPQSLAELESKLALLPGVTEVWSGQEELARLGRLVRAAIWLGVGLLVLVSLAVAFIVFQTVDTSIAGRTREIEIMQLVGASRAVVETPFILEGMFQGALGGLCAFLITVGLARLAALFLPAPLVPVPALLGLSAALGCLLGYVGSAVALDRIRSGRPRRTPQ